MKLKNIIIHAKEYLARGYSVLPINMSAGKRPLGNWKQFQSNYITIDEFYNRCANASINAGIAIITGLISGNLELIDIDEKHAPGISATYLTEVKNVYPELYAKLRIHRTISGGYHILYRCEEVLGDGNRKLAFASNEKGAEAAIETRGEGGYFAVPPTKGYEVYQDMPVPVLSLDERNTLIRLAQLFCKKDKAPKKQRISKKGLNNYSENPWEHYNNSAAAEEILQQFGWQFESENSEFIHFTRPNKKSGVSASFIKSKRLYHIFTSSTQLENERNYLPSTILTELQFGGDTKETFRWLVENGYGKLNPNYEKKLIEKSLTDNTPIPANLSDDAKKLHKKKLSEFEQKYPFGIFWTGNIEDGYSINREMFIDVATKMNYLIYENEIYKQKDNIIYKVEYREFVDELKDYIKEEEEVNFAIKDKYENFLQHSGKYITSRLKEIQEEDILCDEKHTAYKFFQNCIVKVTAKEIKQIPYSDIKKKLIDGTRIFEHDFVPGTEDGIFTDFINKAVVKNPHLRSIIGFSIHEHKDASASYITLCTEANNDPRRGGGSGKNILSAMVGRMTTYKDIPAAQANMDERLLQFWNFERMISFSDLPRNFDLSYLKNISSNSAILKKLYKDQITIPEHLLPKIWAQTNYSYVISDGGVRRRVRVIEFTDFFTNAGGVDTYYNNKMFPIDWSLDDWSAYYNYMINCLQTYLANPKIAETKLTTEGWMKQYEQTYNKHTRQFIEENIENWCEKEFISRELFEEEYHIFCRNNGINARFALSSIKMNDALSDWCDKFNIEFDKNARNTENGIRKFGRTFKSNSLNTNNNEEYDLPF